MIRALLQSHSIKTKTTIYLLCVSLLSIWSLSYYVSTKLRKNMEQQLGEQQFSMVSMLADQIGHQMSMRLTSLSRVGVQLAATLQSHPAGVQQILDERPILQDLFNGGIFVLNSQGTVVADYPIEQGRMGVNFTDRDYAKSALIEGEPYISRPREGRVMKSPVISMAVPIVGANQQIVGALVGTISLSSNNFLSHTTDNLYGKSGGYLLIDAKNRMIITATDKRRIMEELPPPGRLPLIDRFIDGFEGTAVIINPLGQEMQASDKRIPNTHWIISAVIPTEEAFAPIRDMQRDLFLATTLFSLLMAVITWWVLQRQLSPVTNTLKTLAQMSLNPESIEPLPVEKEDEIGLLIGSFNRLIIELKQYQDHLEEMVDSRTSELATARDLAESANRAKSAFLANMTHELRTPLNHIVGFTSLLGKAVSSEQGRSHLAKIDTASRNLLTLINRIIDISRLDSDRINLNIIEFNPGRLMLQVQREVSTALEDSAQSLRIDIAPDVPDNLKGDPIRIAQVLVLLLDNAIKFSGVGEIILRIRCLEKAENAITLRFEVEDHGIGIPDEVQPGLFQLFNQGDNSMTRRYGGTGLGLALSKRLILLMRGQIGFSSTDGKGSTFWFNLPLSPVEASTTLPLADAVDWVQVTQSVDYMEQLLAECDVQSQTLWGKNPAVFAPVLKAQADDFKTALDNFDFEDALKILKAARQTTPELQQGKDAGA